MTVMQIRNIKKSFGEKEVLSNVNLEIKENARIGLVGYNGTGKTTLANIIAGKLQADSGTIETFQTVKIGYLFQSIEYEMIDYLKGTFEVENKDFFTVSSQLGLKKVSNWSEERFHHLSGGEKLKLVLSELWNSKPDLLLLDEPTNHMDLQGMEWLIDELKVFKGPVLIISHDRYFLDQITNTIIELEDGLLDQYEGNYSKYLQEKHKRKQVQLHQYLEQEKYKDKMEHQMEQLTQWSNKAHRESTKHGRDMGKKEYHRVKAKKVDRQVKSKMKRLEKELEKNQINKPKDDPKLAFQFQLEEKKGKRVLEAKNIEKAYGENLLFKKSHFYIKHGEKIGIVGPNGCGKTTFIRLLMGEESLTKGNLWIGHTLKIAYLSQDLLDLNPNQTVLESFGSLTREQIYMAYTYLATIGLSREIANKKVMNLSLGERIRMKIVDMLLKDYDIIVLDEPTNHLDLPSREQLESTLKDFHGTIITVSHDYYFIDSLCSTLLVFENQQIKRIEKSLHEYMESKEAKETPHQNEELMVIENKLSAILGELSLLSATDEKYSLLDAEFKELLQLKKQWHA